MDKFHFKGHVDPWCQEHCNPNKHEGLMKKNMSICEQTFSWVKGFGKLARYMNGCRLNFLALLLTWMHHERFRERGVDVEAEPEEGGGAGSGAASEEDEGEL